jgi:S-adenosylmethionine:diacylglycerol 3-amino-3-carboxypropyl transferase
VAVLNSVSIQEDPFEDMKYLNLSSADSMFVITSAGDNALHYAIEANPKRVGNHTPCPLGLPE